MTFSPEVWSGVGVVGAVMAYNSVLVVAYLTDKLVPGAHVKRIIESRDREIAAKDRTIEVAAERSAKDVDTINTLAAALSDKTAYEAITKQIILDRLAPRE